MIRATKSTSGVSVPSERSGASSDSRIIASGIIRPVAFARLSHRSRTYAHTHTHRHTHAGALTRTQAQPLCLSPTEWPRGSSAPAGGALGLGFEPKG